MPDLKIARLCIDINVLYADLKGRTLRVFPSAASELMEYVASGACPAGGVQLVVSVPMIEQWQNVLMRHFHYSQKDAEDLSALLYDIANDGPVPLHPLVVVGSDFIPFASEVDALRAAVIHGLSHDTSNPLQNKLFNELDDDRHVLMTAIAGRADILATANIRDFRRYKITEFARDDVLIVPGATHHLVVAKPSFVAFWLARGVIPNWAFISANPDLFPGQNERDVDAPHPDTT